MAICYQCNKNKQLFRDKSDSLGRTYFNKPIHLCSFAFRLFWKKGSDIHHHTSAVIPALFLIFIVIVFLPRQILILLARLLHTASFTATQSL